MTREISERDVQLAIVRELGASIVCAAPNYTPIGWWECDLWSVTRSGYAVEYEIKMSVGDFRVDAAKARNKWRGMDAGVVRESKHEKLRESSEAGPSRFYFVVHRSMADHAASNLPEWAGLMDFGRDRGRVFLFTHKEAPRLHKTKVSRREITLCQRRMWFRYWELLRTSAKAELEA